MLSRFSSCGFTLVRTQMHPDIKRPSQTFGELVFELRQQRQWSQRELARKAGIAPSVLCETENARRAPPCEETVERISLALKTSSEQRHALSEAAQRERLGIGLKVGKNTPKHVAELLRQIAFASTAITPTQVKLIQKIMEGLME